MAGNTVTLNFTGQTKQLEDSFDRVGSSSKEMGRKVEESSDGFHKAGEAADEVDTKAMGFRDTLTGVQDSMKGTSLIAKGDLFNGFLTLGMGVGDLGSGFYNFLIPAFAKAKTAVLGLNLTFLSSPIFWVIAAVVLLVAAIVLIATKTDWFQRAWRAAWGWIKDAASNTWEWLKKLPGWIGSAFATVANAITAPFRWAFNFIADAWNHTIGRLSWTVPGWVPFIGGNTISVPNLPKFHSGGVVPGVPGSEQLALLQAGERVETRGAGGGDVVHVVVKIDRDTLLDVIAKGNRRGGLSLG